MARPWRLWPATSSAIPSAATCCRSCTGWPGFAQLGYDVVFVEHHGWPNACWNPAHEDAERRPVRTASTSWPATPAGSACAAWCFVDRAGHVSRAVAAGARGALQERRCADRAVDGDLARGIRRMPPPHLHRHRSRVHAVRHVAGCARQPGVRLAGRLPRALQLRHAHRAARLPDPDARHQLAAAASAGGARPAAGALRARRDVLHHGDGLVAAQAHRLRRCRVRA